MLYILLATSFSILILLILIYKKVRRIDLNSWNIEKRISALLKNEFRQIEALLALRDDLKLNSSLPATRNWAGSPDFLHLLSKTVFKMRPNSIVECSSGVSTIVLARSAQLSKQGHIYSLEHDAKYANATREELKKNGLEEWATVIDAPLIDITTKYGNQKWYDISSLPCEHIDLLVVDGPPESTNPMARYPAGEFLIPRLSEDGILVLDDANRDDEQEIIQDWIDAYPNLEVFTAHAEKGAAVISIKK